MGKSTKPLTIVVIGDITHWPEWEKMEFQGHKIITVKNTNQLAWADLIQADLVLGPRCWRMNKDLSKYLALALKEGRLVHYGHDVRSRKANRDAAGADIESALADTDNSGGPVSDRDHSAE